MKVAIVEKRSNESIDGLLRRFKKEVEGAGIISEVKKREYYKKPSIKKNEAKRERRRVLAKLRKKAEDLDKKFPK